MTSRRRAPRRREWPVVAAVLVAGLLASVGVIVFSERRSVTTRVPRGPGIAAAPTAVLSNPSRAAAVVTAATADVTAIASYDYRHLAADRASGAAATTGLFRTSYQNSMLTTVQRSAIAKRTVQTFLAQDAGICALSPDNTIASALVFGLEAVTSGVAAKRVPVVSPLVVGVTLQLVGGHWLVSVLQQGLGPVVSPPGSPQLIAAAVAGLVEVQRLLSYLRANFAADYARALAGATASLRAGLLARRAAVLSSMRAGGYDTSGQVVGLAVMSASGNTVVLLVAAQTTDIAPSGIQRLPATPRLQVSMRVVDGRWLVDSVSPVADR